MKVLGIETSCDETAASIVNDNREILSNVIVSQIEEHKKFGGVVPEIASRSHLLYLQKTVAKALIDANCKLKDVDAIAVTSGPGLIGGLLVGIMFAKGLSFSSNKPLLGINHLEGHALTARLTNKEVTFPYLMLLVSGGHCQILLVENVAKYKKLGGTLDDAVGEAFDKVAKMLGLDYPGGPIVEKLALNGKELAYNLPLAMKGRQGCDFSFSGLKTAVRLIIEKEELNPEVISNICASFQKAVAEIIIDRLNNAIKSIVHLKINQLIIAGGVAANQYLLNKISDSMLKKGFVTIAPPIKLCTDNGAMIAWAGLERFRLGLIDNLNIAPYPRWPLEQLYRE
jgi:N6-L-threonylcarbamoyladenine synthase